MTTVTLDHTIVAGNFQGTGSTRDDISGAVISASAYNLIGVNTGLTGITNSTNGNQIGTGASPKDPGLLPLANYGGPTETHALAANSLAIDAGNPSATAGVGTVPEFDQRGVGRIFEGTIDIGAYEWRGGTPAKVANVMVNRYYYETGAYSFDQVDGSGQQLVTVPVGGADTVFVTFSEAVSVAEESLTLVGLYSGHRPTVSGFGYSGTSYTAFWYFTDVLANDMYLISLSDEVTDADGSPLDGEWVNPASIFTTSAAISEFPSGDGNPGGNFNFAFTLLSGDFSLDNAVDSTDSEILANAIWDTWGMQFIDGDASGDGMITYVDDYTLFQLSSGLVRESVFLWGDLDDDFHVDDADLAILLDNLASNLANPTYADGDMNNDGVLNMTDFDLLLAQIGFRLTVVS
jgi:hypothetical protein